MSAPIVLCDTKGMTNERWLECRMHGPKGDIPYTIGGSDVAAVFGVSPWVTPLELWKIKKGQMKPPLKNNLAQLNMGHLLEPIAAQLYAEKTGNIVEEDTMLYQHADFKYALANFDRRFTDAATGEKGILECKSTSYHMASHWAGGAYPLYYEFQLRFYLAVADLRIGDFSALWGNNPDNDLATPRLMRDRAKEDMIFEKLDYFIWSLEHDVPPTMDGINTKLALESLAKIYPKSNPKLAEVIFAGKHEALLRRILALQEQKKNCNAEIKIIEEEIKKHSVRIIEMMRDHEHGVLETTADRILIDFVTKQSTKTDKGKLQKLYPDVYKDVVNETESRTLKISVEPKKAI